MSAGQLHCKARSATTQPRVTMRGQKNCPACSASASAFVLACVPPEPCSRKEMVIGDGAYIARLTPAQAARRLPPASTKSHTNLRSSVGTHRGTTGRGAKSVRARGMQEGRAEWAGRGKKKGGGAAGPQKDKQFANQSQACRGSISGSPKLYRLSLSPFLSLLTATHSHILAVAVNAV